MAEFKIKRLNFAVLIETGDSFDRLIFHRDSLAHDCDLILAEQMFGVNGKI